MAHKLYCYIFIFFFILKCFMERAFNNFYVGGLPFDLKITLPCIGKAISTAEVTSAVHINSERIATESKLLRNTNRILI